MYQKKNGDFLPDNFDHEQSLVFETEKGLVIFSSCSHAGAADIIGEVSETFTEKKVFYLIGGFNLFNKTDEENPSPTTSTLLTLTTVHNV